MLLCVSVMLPGNKIVVIRCPTPLCFYTIRFFLTSVHRHSTRPVGQDNWNESTHAHWSRYAIYVIFTVLLTSRSPCRMFLSWSFHVVIFTVLLQPLWCTVEPQKSISLDDRWCIRANIVTSQMIRPNKYESSSSPKRIIYSSCCSIVDCNWQ